MDIDADGDYDLLAGESEIPGPPCIRLYLNIGDAQNPYYRLEDAEFITNPDFFVNANPGVADIDNDGDYDLFISEDDGYFYFYQNDGSASWPDFTLITSQWQGIYFEHPQTGWRRFSFADIDNDNDLDLLMRNIWQTDYANVRIYR